MFKKKNTLKIAGWKEINRHQKHRKTDSLSLLQNVIPLLMGAVSVLIAADKSLIKYSCHCTCKRVYLLSTLVLVFSGLLV